MVLERYRIWLDTGKYEVSVAHNRIDAVYNAIRDKGVLESSVTHVGKSTSNGRLFVWGD